MGFNKTDLFYYNKIIIIIIKFTLSGSHTLGIIIILGLGVKQSKPLIKEESWHV